MTARGAVLIQVGRQEGGRHLPWLGGPQLMAPFFVPEIINNIFNHHAAYVYCTYYYVSMVKHFSPPTLGRREGVE